MAGGLEQEGWGLGRVSRAWGLEGGWGLEALDGAGGLGGGGLEPGRRDGHSLVRLLARMDRNFPNMFYRTSYPSGPLPKRGQKMSFSCVKKIFSTILIKIFSPRVLRCDTDDSRHFENFCQKIIFSKYLSNPEQTGPSSSIRLEVICT